ncbi:MAG: hypothetical protein QT02_C0003G0037 [archaeon GW2011_AR9]|nr:MAG: hypothetical protein QT02_C0003G0037 [archaeon GW2011_AR9]MBS3120962.1 hypothetical protein [Candidatus Woesearchaeota archaeon]HIH13581.1 hypothetical protein [Candidatus Woesearchaeota archaeon]
MSLDDLLMRGVEIKRPAPPLGTKKSLDLMEEMKLEVSIPGGIMIGNIQNQIDNPYYTLGSMGIVFALCTLFYYGYNNQGKRNASLLQLAIYPAALTGIAGITDYLLG